MSENTLDDLSTAAAPLELAPLSLGDATMDCAAAATTDEDDDSVGAQQQLKRRRLESLSTACSSGDESQDFDDDTNGGSSTQVPWPSSLQPCTATLSSLLSVHTSGPLDFGGQLVDFLWHGVRLVYSAPVEYLLLICLGSKAAEEHGGKGGGGPGAKREVAPELCALMRCSRSVRLGAIAAAEVRRRTVEPGDRHRLQEICEEVKIRYPLSYRVAHRSWAWVDARGSAGTISATMVGA